MLFYPFGGCLCDVYGVDLAQSFDGFVKCAFGFSTEGMDGVYKVDACDSNLFSNRGTYGVLDSLLKMEFAFK